MKVAGIIAEYNPFHRGHEYHIQKTRELTKAEYIIIVMSGNFTQRGHAAIMDKYSRAGQALNCGADLVLELPVCFATGSAPIFAHGAVSLLHKLGVVDYLSFGSEAGTLNNLKKISAFLENEPEVYRKDLQQNLKKGFSFPKARAEALGKVFGGDLSFLLPPNNILGIEYCSALSVLNSDITPITVQRIHSAYHDTTLSEVGYSSATAIRKFLMREELHALKSHVPREVYDIFKKEWKKSFPLFSNDFSGLLHYKLLSEQGKDFSIYADVPSALSDRINCNLYSFESFESFCVLLKTKQLTHSRISRDLLHILLGLKAYDLQLYKENGYARYARALGFNKQASPLLHAIKAKSSIPLITKLADFAGKMDPLSNSMLEYDIRSSHIYESVLSAKFRHPFRNEFIRQYPILP